MASSLNTMPPEVLKRILSFIEIPAFPLPTSSPSAARSTESVLTISPVDNAVLDSASPDASDARRSAKEGLKTLVALALSCRALSEPALDLIWSTLPSLVPLVRTLPSDLWQEVPAEYEGGKGHVFGFVRPPTPEDFTRFKSYASRVKHICRRAFDLPICQVYFLPIEGYDVLESFGPPARWLPNLESLEVCSGYPVLDLAPWHLFGTANLKRLNFWVDVPHLACYPALVRRVEAFFAGLKYAYAPLSHINLHIEPCFPAVQEAVEDALLGLTQLTSFQWHENPALRPALLAHLSRLPNLHGLAVKVLSDGKPGPQLLSRLEAGCFPALQMLHLTTDALERTHHLFQTMRPDGLRSLAVRLAQPVSADELCSIFEVLALRQPRLTELEVLLPEATAAGYPFPTRTVLPLLRVRSLKTVRLGSCPIAVDGVLIRGMALAWLDLEYAELCTNRDAPHELASLFDAPLPSCAKPSQWSWRRLIDGRTLSSPEPGAVVNVERTIRMRIGNLRLEFSLEATAYPSDVICCPIPRSRPTVSSKVKDQALRRAADENELRALLCRADED